MDLPKLASSSSLPSWRFAECVRGIGLHGPLCQFHFERCLRIPPSSQTCRDSQSRLHGETGGIRGHEVFYFTEENVNKRKDGHRA